MSFIVRLQVLQKIPVPIIQRYLNLFNFVFEHLFNGKIIFEEIEQGFMIISDSLRSFEGFWGRYPKQEIKRCKEHPLEENFILKKDLTEENFPKGGIKMLMEFTSEPRPPEVGDVVKNFFGQFSDAIKVSVNLPFITIYFPDYKDFKLYTDLLHVKFRRVFPKTFIEE